MTRKLEITVDKTRCVSNQMCMQYAPGVFGPDENGQARVVDPNGGSEEEILEAGYNCPVAAIDVRDADSGEDLLV